MATGAVTALPRCRSTDSAVAGGVALDHAVLPGLILSYDAGSPAVVGLGHSPSTF